MVNRGILLIVILIFFLGCNSGEGPASPTDPTPAPSTCGPFGDWATSPYVLPYPVGTSYQVNQGNCSGFGHSGFWTYGYDFIMPIGTFVTASRAGVIVYTEGRAADGNGPGLTNLVIIDHADGTFMLYSHLTNGGALVEVGAVVQAGDPIGRSGNTGNTGGLPHLHQSLHPCAELPGLPNEANCPSIPFNFRNTDPNPEGLDAGRTYAAF